MNFLTKSILALTLLSNSAILSAGKLEADGTPMFTNFPHLFIDINRELDSLEPIFQCDVRGYMIVSNRLYLCTLITDNILDYKSNSRKAPILKTQLKEST